jgi:hypothetical protein
VTLDRRAAGAPRFPGAPRIQLEAIPLKPELVAMAPSAVPIARADTALTDHREKVNP